MSSIARRSVPGAASASRTGSAQRASAAITSTSCGNGTPTSVCHPCSSASSTWDGVVSTRSSRSASSPTSIPSAVTTSSSVSSSCVRRLLIRCTSASLRSTGADSSRLSEAADPGNRRCGGCRRCRVVTPARPTRPTPDRRSLLGRERGRSHDGMRAGAEALRLPLPAAADHRDGGDRGYERDQEGDLPNV